MSSEFPLSSPLLKSFPFTALTVYASVKAGLLYASLLFLFTLFHYLNTVYQNKVILYSYLFIVLINLCVIFYVLINSTEYFIKRIIIGILVLIAILCLFYKETDGYLVLMGISFLYTIQDRDINTIMRTLYYD